MVMTHHAEFKRLILQIERDLVSQATENALDPSRITVTDHVQELRTVKARLKRTRHVNGISIVTKWKRGRHHTAS
jgi:hypothetical protein